MTVFCATKRRASFGVRGEGGGPMLPYPRPKLGPKPLGDGCLLRKGGELRKEKGQNGADDPSTD